MPKTRATGSSSTRNRRATNTPDGGNNRDNEAPTQPTTAELATLLENLRKDKAKEQKEREKRDKELMESIAELRGLIPVNGHGGARQPTPSTSNTSIGRHIDISGLEKMAGDISLKNFQSWRTKWNDFCHLERISTFPRSEQRAAFRMSLSDEMLQIVETVLNIPTTAATTPDAVLDHIRCYIRKKRSVALDRMEFEQCRQELNESFDSFYIRLQRIAACADLCARCVDERMTTRVIVGIRDQETRKRLLALAPFPALQTVIDLHRSEESASLSGPHLVIEFHHHSRGRMPADSFPLPQLKTFFLLLFSFISVVRFAVICRRSHS